MFFRLVDTQYVFLDWGEKNVFCLFVDILLKVISQVYVKIECAVKITDKQCFTCDNKCLNLS